MLDTINISYKNTQILFKIQFPNIAILGQNNFKQSYSIIMLISPLNLKQSGSRHIWQLNGHYL